MPSEVQVNAIQHSFIQQLYLVTADINTLVSVDLVISLLYSE